MTRQKAILFAGGAFSLGLAAWLIFGAAPRNMSYFLTPAEVRAGVAPPGANIRVGGIVKSGSLKLGTPGNTSSLVLVDGPAEVAVDVRGTPLPALLREGQQAVADGRMEDGRLVANSVIPRFDDPLKVPANR